MVYLYWGSIFIGVFFSFFSYNEWRRTSLATEPGFHPSDLPFAPSPDRAIPRHPDPSIVWNILSFAC